MTWAKIDDQFHNHPKLALLGSLMLPCVGLHALALSWCSQYLTDGVIPSGQVHKLAGDVEPLLSGFKIVGNAVTDLAARLVDVGLWEEIDEVTYQIHDYLEYNPSKRDVIKQRKETENRVHKHRLRNAVSNAVTNGVVTASPIPVPIPLKASKKTRSVHSREQGRPEPIQNELTRQLDAIAQKHPELGPT